MNLEEILISIVRENKSLYDKTDKQFKNTTKKKDLWKLIAINLKTLYDIDTTAEAVESRWTSLRDQFTREHRKRKTPPSGSGFTPLKEWEYYRSMMFLIPHISHRRYEMN
ncbi:hypothetical protein ALC62_12359 [Cyphomyrmex costatus]|uniref:MADF domain-containing protein n=1 Tax=Cyphomyrmex costatus TaxID=456900 RepID=A0A151IBF2_9HYME|nr:hypothetical protein ALC62_12359 [Cyphomyrmex costatus]